MRTVDQQYYLWAAQRCQRRAFQCYADANFLRASDPLTRMASMWDSKADRFARDAEIYYQKARGKLS